MKRWMVPLAWVLWLVMVAGFIFVPMAFLTSRPAKAAEPEETYVIMTARDLDRLVRAFNAALAELERSKKRPAAHCS